MNVRLRKYLLVSLVCIGALATQDTVNAADTLTQSKATLVLPGATLTLFEITGICPRANPDDGYVMVAHYNASPGAGPVVLLWNGSFPDAGVTEFSAAVPERKALLTAATLPANYQVGRIVRMPKGYLICGSEGNDEHQMSFVDYYPDEDFTGQTFSFKNSATPARLHDHTLSMKLVNNHTVNVVALGLDVHDSRDVMVTGYYPPVATPDVQQSRSFVKLIKNVTSRGNVELKEDQDRFEIPLSHDAASTLEAQDVSQSIVIGHSRAGKEQSFISFFKTSSKLPEHLVYSDRVIGLGSPTADVIVQLFGAGGTLVVGSRQDGESTNSSGGILYDVSDTEHQLNLFPSIREHNIFDIVLKGVNGNSANWAAVGYYTDTSFPDERPIRGYLIRHTSK